MFVVAFVVQRPPSWPWPSPRHHHDPSPAQTVRTTTLLVPCLAVAAPPIPRVSLVCHAKSTCSSSLLHFARFIAAYTYTYRCTRFHPATSPPYPPRPSSIYYTYSIVYIHYNTLTLAVVALKLCCMVFVVVDVVAVVVIVVSGRTYPRVHTDHSRRLVHHLCLSVCRDLFCANE